MSEFYKNLGRNLVEARKAKGLTQKDAAPYLGLSRPSLANIEVGRQNVYAHQLAAIAAAYDTTADRLMKLSTARDLIIIKPVSRKHQTPGIGLASAS